MLNQRSCLNKHASSFWRPTSNFEWSRPHKHVKMGGKWAENGLKTSSRLWCSSGLPGPSWVFVNTRGVFIQHYMIVCTPMVHLDTHALINMPTSFYVAMVSRRCHPMSIFVWVVIQEINVFPRESFPKIKVPLTKPILFACQITLENMEYHILPNKRACLNKSAPHL